MTRSEEEEAALIRQALGPEGLVLWLREVTSRGIRPRVRALGPPTSFMARGQGGQFLWVSPRERLVVVCMHRERADATVAIDVLEFPEFPSLAGALLGAPARAPP